MKTIISYSLILICLSFNFVAQTQDKKGEQYKDVRVNVSKPSVYITFEKSAKRKPLHQGESDEGIWLRLHNNNIWSINFRVNGVPNKSYGDYTIPYGVEKLPEWKMLIKEDDVPIGNLGGHVHSVIDLEPGKSFLFSIPKEHLADGLKISVEFKYSWEKDFSYDGPKHIVYYSSEDLPPGMPVKEELSCDYLMKLPSEQKTEFFWLSDRLDNLAVHCVVPTLPEGMITKGRIKVDVWVGADGIVKCVQVPKGNPDIRQIAEVAARQWKFTPYKVDNKPAAVGGTLTLFYSSNPEEGKQCLDINQSN